MQVAFGAAPTLLWNRSAVRKVVMKDVVAQKFGKPQIKGSELPFIKTKRAGRGRALEGITEIYRRKGTFQLSITDA